MTGPVAYVHLGYGLDADRYRERFLAGDEPDESPYGFHVARSLGWTVRFSRDHAESGATRFIRRAIKKLLGFDPLHLWRNRHALHGADVVWTMQESEWLALRFVAPFHAPARLPVIGNTVWLFDRWNRMAAPLRWLYARLARGAGVMTVHSDRYLPIVRAALPGVRVERMYFGTSMQAHPLCLSPIRPREKDEPIRVLAAGNDRTRDWDTLLEALGNDPRFDIELVCRWVPEEQRRSHASVRPRATSTAHRLAEFQALYDWADIVAVPMHENRFSGITVALEATANGKPLLVSRTGGVPTYFDEGEALYVPPGDAFALLAAALTPPAEALTRARAAQARFRREDYSTAGMMRRYIALSLDVMRDR